MCLLLALSSILSGCGNQVELIASGQPVMIAQPVKFTPAYPDGHGGAVIGKNQITAPAGWYVVPPPPSTQP